MVKFLWRSNKFELIVKVDSSILHTGKIKIPGHIRKELHAGVPNPSRLARLVAAHLDFLIDSRGAAEPRIAEAPAFIAAVREKMAPLKDRKHAWLRVEHVLLKTELQLSSHGIMCETSSGEIRARYSAFSEKHAESLYNSLFGWIESRIEDDLYIAQMELFNNFRFSDVFASLQKDRAMYLRIVEVIKNFDLEDHFTRDRFYASLSGTLGQACAFLAGLADDTDDAGQLYRQAANYLSEDIQCLQRGSYEWVQGVNFLATLEWRRGNIAAALRWLAESLLSPGPLHLADLVRMDGPDALVPPSDPQHGWILLNQVRILSLAVRRGDVKIPAETAARWLAAFLKWPDAAYPRNLVIKWLAVLAGDSGAISADLCRRAVALLAPERSIPVLELMRAVELSLVAKLAPQTATADEIKDLAKSILEKLSLDRNFETFLSTNQWAAGLLAGESTTMTAYDIATALPYYYA